MAELEGSRAALEARSVKVVVVAFGAPKGARLWLQQTGCSLDLVLDPHRKIYRSFGLISSCAKVMNFDSMLRYSEYQAADRSFPEFPMHMLEDIYQMGGDFLLSGTNKVLLSHPSKYPMDRPTLGDILRTASGSTELVAKEASGSGTPMHADDVTPRSHNTVKRCDRCQAVLTGLPLLPLRSLL